MQVKIQPVAKYDWEHKYYYGRLIAVSNSFLAYAIRGESWVPVSIYLYLQMTQTSKKYMRFLKREMLPHFLES